MSEQTIPPNDYDGARAWYLALMEKWEVNINVSFSRLAPDPAQGTLTPSVLRAALAMRLRMLEDNGAADLSGIDVESFAAHAAQIDFVNARVAFHSAVAAEILATEWSEKAMLAARIRTGAHLPRQWVAEERAAARALLARDPIAQAVIEARIQSGAAPSSDRADFLDACLGIRTFEAGEDFDAGETVAIGSDGKAYRVRPERQRYNTWKKEDAMSKETTKTGGLEASSNAIRRIAKENAYDHVAIEGLDWIPVDAIGLPQQVQFPNGLTGTIVASREPRPDVIIPPRSADLSRAEAIDAVTRESARCPDDLTPKLYRFALIGACYSVEPADAAKTVTACAAALHGPRDEYVYHDWFAWYRAAERGGLDGVIQRAGRGDPWGFMGEASG